MSEREGHAAEGDAPESGDYVSGPGGPTATQGGVMPGGPEMENWKPPRRLPESEEPEGTLQEQAENVRQLAEDAKNK